MANGRTDEQGTPLVAGAFRCRLRVWGLFGETHLGQRSCSRVEGRTHDRTRSVSQIKQNPLRSGGRPHMQQRLSAPHSERNPFVTLRKITLGRSARSETLLVGGTPRSVTNTNRCSRSRAMRRRSFSAVSPRRGSASTRSSLRSRSARYCRSVLSCSASRRRPMAMARSSRRLNAAEKASSPQSMAYCASRSRCARQTCHRSACPRWLARLSDTQTRGRMPPNSARTTSAPRLGRMMCSTATALTNTHSQHVFFITRTEVSSEAITSDVVTCAAITVAAAVSGALARASMLLIAPSLIDRAKISPSSVRSRSRPIAWA
jgi:hypothetical protein